MESLSLQNGTMSMQYIFGTIKVYIRKKDEVAKNIQMASNWKQSETPGWGVGSVSHNGQSIRRI